MNWVCPQDREPLVEDAGSLRCESCGATYETAGMVTRFGGPENGSALLEPLLRGFEEGRIDEALDEFCAAHRCVNSLRGDDWKFLLAAAAGSRVLEIGAGYGRDSVDLARDAGEVVSLAPDPVSARLVQLHAAARGAENVRVAVVGDPARLPIPDASVDAIVFEDAAAVSFGMFRGLSAGVAREWTRVLAPGGRLLIGVANPLYRSRLVAKLKAGLGAGRERRSMNRLIKGVARPAASAGLRRGRIERELKKLGLPAPEAYAPLPDEDRTQFLVPLDDPLVVRYFLDHLVRKMSWKVRLAIRICKILLRLGLFDRVMPYQYLVFTRPGPPAGGS